MELVGKILAWVVAVVFGALLYDLAFVLLRGYVAQIRDIDVNEVDRKFNIKIALAVPVVAGLFAFVMWIARESIKSGMYSDNASATLNFTSFFIALLAGFIAHTYYSITRRFRRNLLERDSMAYLASKVEKLENENLELRRELKEAQSTIDFYEFCNDPTNEVTLP